MITFLAIIHIIACLGLVGLVMVQDSKGGGVFSSGGSSNSVLGATGATTLAQTMTKILAGIFALTCIALSIMSAQSERSVLDSTVVTPAGQTAPMDTPAAAAAPTTTEPSAANPVAPAAPPAATEQKK